MKLTSFLKRDLSNRLIPSLLLAHILICNASSSLLPFLKYISFSFSHSKGVESLARTVLRDPVRVVVGVRNGSNPNVTQSLRYCGTEEGKLLALRNMLRERFEPPMLVFVQSKERARQLYNELAYESRCVLGVLA